MARGAGILQDHFAGFPATTACCLLAATLRAEVLHEVIDENRFVFVLERGAVGDHRINQV